MRDCNGCALKPKKRGRAGKIFSWSVKAVLILIVMLAVWEQFIKPVTAEKTAAQTAARAIAP